VWHNSRVRHKSSKYGTYIPTALHCSPALSCRVYPTSRSDKCDMNVILLLGYRSQPPPPSQHAGNDDPELQEAIRRSLAEERPPHNQSPIGFEHLQTTGQNNIGFGHLEREASNNLQHHGQGSQSDIGFEHLEREENSSVRHRGSQMSAEQLRAARVARFERNT